MPQGTEFNKLNNVNSTLSGTSHARLHMQVHIHTDTRTHNLTQQSSISQQILCELL